MYKSLQMGRGAAALLVVLYHLGRALSLPQNYDSEVYFTPFSFGNAGVDFFFVLSGFIIMTAHRKDIAEPGKIGRFVKKRFIRIYPAYWIVFAVAYVFYSVSPGAKDILTRNLLAIAQSLLLIPQGSYGIGGVGGVVGGVGSPVLVVAWTLRYEMFFYFLFALLILNRWLAVIAGLSLLGIYGVYFNVENPPFPWSFLASNYLWLFGMGMIISMVHSSKKVSTKNPWLYLALGGLLFGAIAMETLLGTGLILPSKAVVLYGIASSLMIFGLVRMEDSGTVIGGNAPMQLMGDASYAIYLTHFFLIPIFCKLAMMLQINRLGVTAGVTSYVVIFIVTVACGIFFHLRVEKPIGVYLRKVLM